MTKTLAEIERDALTLSDHERSKLAQHLLETLDKDEDEEVEEIWLAEAEKRYEEYRKGNIKGVMAEQAFSEARSRLG